jgi:hypothetical protein
MKRTVRFFGIAIGFLALSSAVASAREARDLPRVVPVSSTVFGRSYLSWNMEWARFEWSASVDKSPLLHPEGCRHKMIGGMFLLPGPFGGRTIRCRVPRGHAVFVPTSTGFAIRTNPKKGTLSRGTLSALKREAAGQFRETKVLDVTIDGRKLNVRQFATMTRLFTINMLKGNPLHARPGKHVAIQAGYNFILSPLDTGHHKITVHVKIERGTTTLYEARTAFELSVIP